MSKNKKPRNEYYSTPAHSQRRNASFWFAVGASTLSFVGKKLELPDWALYSALSIAILAFVAAGWMWTGEFTHSNSDLSRRADHQRLLRLIVAGLTLSVGAFSGATVYLRASRNERIHQLEEKLREQDTIIARYKHVVELSPNPSQNTTLTELNNAELKRRGSELVTSLRSMTSRHRAKIAAIRKQYGRKEISDGERFGQEMEIEMAARDELQKKYLTDATTTLWELKNRIPESARVHLIDTDVKSEDGTGRTPVLAITSSVMGIATADALANELEELAKLLPP